MLRLLPPALLLLPVLAAANPRSLPYTYPYETLGQGQTEIEQFVDVTPLRSWDTAGELRWTPSAVLTTELEYGILDRLELGLYLQFADDLGSTSGGVPLRFNGVKSRLRLRLAEAGEWPVDVSLYGEVALMRDELELEAKLNLQKRLGPVRVMVNLWAEREFYYSGRQEWVANPTAGVTWELNPNVHLGLEYWMRAEFGGPAPQSELERRVMGPNHFLGPAVMLNLGRFWWSTAPYVRLNGLNQEIMLGETYGHVVVRSIIGMDL